MTEQNCPINVKDENLPTALCSYETYIDFYRELVTTLRVTTYSHKSCLFYRTFCIIFDVALCVLNVLTCFFFQKIDAKCSKNLFKKDIEKF